MSDDLETRFRAILKCLLECKKAIVNKYTLQTQNPSDLEDNVKPVLNEICSDLTNFMVDRTRPLNSDEYVQSCISCLEKALNPWDMDLSILAPRWCEMIFKGSEFSLSNNIIEEIIKNSMPETEKEDETPI
jgi:hypothetical protein